jgi:hypothetical protein
MRDPLGGRSMIRSKALAFQLSLLLLPHLAASQVASTLHLPQQYAWLQQPSPLSDDSLKAIRAALPYDSITIHHLGCAGFCPRFRATLRRDGSATFVGDSLFATRTGSFVGTVDVWDYGRLCFLLDRYGFMRLAPRYTTPETEEETIVFFVAHRGAPTKEVYEYGASGPITLWIFHMALDGVLSHIYWERPAK